MKVVINVCFGGYSLSNEAIILFAQRKGIELFRYYCDNKSNIYRRIDLHSPIDETGFRSFFTIENHGERVESKDLKIFEYVYNYPRNDEDLIFVVESLKESANGRCAELKIVEIPDDVSWHIEEYDGMEHVAENHRTWY